MRNQIIKTVTYFEDFSRIKECLNLGFDMESKQGRESSVFFSTVSVMNPKTLIIPDLLNGNNYKDWPCLARMVIREAKRTWIY